MRNEGKAKGGYYRTPEAIVKALARFIKLPAYSSEVTLLDPCCGKGIALDLLTKEIKKNHTAIWEAHKIPKLVTYGIEPNKYRLYKASRRLDHTMTASFFDAVLSNGSVNVGFLNPPYDWDDEAIKKSGARERLEVSFLRKATIKLTARGILIFVIPQHILKDAATILASWYKNFQFFRFPDTTWDPREEEEIKDGKKLEPVSMYGQFKQCVLIAEKNSFQQPPAFRDVEMLEIWADMGERAPVLPMDITDEIRPFSLSSYALEMKYFSAKAFDPDKAAQMCSVLKGTTVPNAGVWASPAYQKSHWPNIEDQRVSVGRPMAPLKKSHLAILAVAGFVNGSTLVGRNGTRLTIKGYSRKVPSFKKIEDEEAITETQTDRYESALIAINPDTMQLYCIDAGKPVMVPFALHFERMSMQAFLDNFGTALTEEIARTNPAVYMGEFQVPWGVQALKHLLRRPLGRQRDFIMAQVNYLMNVSSRSGEIAEMATGKTYLSLAIAYLGDLWCSGLVDQFPVRHEGKRTNRRRVKPPHMFPAVVLTPEIMTYKWKREAEQTIPGVKAVVVQRIDTPERVAELQAFDPGYDGTYLSAVGCMDRVVARIERELDSWQERYKEAERYPTLLPLPKKPAHLVIINSSTAKMGMEWTPCYHLRAIRTTNEHGKVVLQRDPETEQPVLVPCCPHCGKPVKNEDRVKRVSATDAAYKKVLAMREILREEDKQKEAYTEEVEDPVVVFATEMEIWGDPKNRRKWVCSECNGALWQNVTAQGVSWQSTSPLSFREGEIISKPLPLPRENILPPTVKSTAKRRFPVADYLKRRYPGFFNLLITDEIHQGADGTAIGLARESLMRASRRTVGLTGTLCNGKASSLLPLLRMVNKGVMEEYGYNGTNAWVKAYGVLQKQVKHYKERDTVNTVTGAVTKRRASTGKVTEKEIAGFSPQGLRWVLDCCNFLELSDVAPNLHKHREYIHSIPLGDTLEKAYSKFASEITQALGKMLVKGDKSGLSAWFNALLIYPNMPWEGFTCRVKQSGELLGIAPKLPENMIYPKERDLITYVEGQHKLGKRVLVYTTHTGSYDLLPRLQKILTQEVKSDRPLTVKILRSETVKPIYREEWLRKIIEQENVDVLICNPALVQVGLDLIDFLSIVFYELPTSTSTLRQASRRNNRPGKKGPSEVVYMAYPTMEMRMLGLMAAKTRTSMMVEGQIGQEGLVAFQGEDEDSEGGDKLALQMANSILKAMEDGSESDILDAGKAADMLQDMFTEAAEIEQEMQNTVSLDQEGHLIESSANKYLGVETEEEGEPKEKVVPVVLEEITQHILVIPEHDPESGIIEEPVKEPVLVVPVSPLTDPWEILLAQVKGVPKKGGKKKRGEESVIATSGMAASLWSA